MMNEYKYTGMKTKEEILVLTIFQIIQDGLLILYNYLYII